MDKKPLIIIAGPTAIGKSSLAVSLAQKINGEIISADSMQVYKYMDIGTAKITESEMGGIRHYLIDVLEPEEDFNIVYFQTEAKKAMDEIWTRSKIPIICGGTGFYIQSVVYDIDFTEEGEDADYRDELNRIAKVNGNEYLHDMLKKIDPASAQKLHSNDLKRVIRALEYYKNTGEKISDHNAGEAIKESPYDTYYFVLDDNREEIYSRIDKRVDNMIADGLVEEVRKLMQRGLTEDYVSMKGLGYKEIIAYLSGENTLEEAVRVIKRDTRHFAKRQLTWFKRERNVHWIQRDSEENMINEIMKVMCNSSV